MQINSLSDLWPALLGILVPSFIRFVKRLITSPDHQEKMWEDHDKKHDEHTKEHGKMDARIEKSHSRIDALEKENRELRDRLIRLEAVKEAA